MLSWTRCCFCPAIVAPPRAAVHHLCQGNHNVYPQCGSWASASNAVYGKSAAEDLEDQLRFEEGDDPVEAAAHDPLTLISQPSAPVVVPPPPTVPPPAVPAPQQGTAEAEDPTAGQAVPVIGGIGMTGAVGGEPVQPQPAGLPQQQPAQAAAEAAVVRAAESAAAADAQQPVPAAAAAAAVDAQTQSTSAGHPLVQQAVLAKEQPMVKTAQDKPAQPAPSAANGAAGSSTAQAAPGRDGEASNSSNASAASSDIATAAVTAAAGPGAPLVPQAALGKQSPTKPKLAMLDGDEKQFQLQLQSSRLGKSVYDLLVQVGSLRGLLAGVNCSQCHAAPLQPQQNEFCLRATSDGQVRTGSFDPMPWILEAMETWVHGRLPSCTWPAGDQGNQGAAEGAAEAGGGAAERCRGRAGGPEAAAAVSGVCCGAHCRAASPRHCFVHSACQSDGSGAAPRKAALALYSGTSGITQRQKHGTRN